MNNGSVVKQEQNQMFPAETMTIKDKVAMVKQQIEAVGALMQQTMIEGEHYGKIPGVEKNSLFKSGAEKLCTLFQLAPKFNVDIKYFPNDHREYIITCSLYHKVTGSFLGEGWGSSSTMEQKYRYRNGERVCPSCGKPTIIKGKEEYGGGYICYAKKGGCGAKFQDGDPAIESQSVGQVENQYLADTYNTVLKMGKKRSLIDAVLTATGASDIFTQDVEDMDIPPKTVNPEPKKDQVKTELLSDRYKALPAKVRALFDELATDGDMEARYQYCEKNSWDVNKIEGALNKRKEKQSSQSAPKKQEQKTEPATYDSNSLKMYDALPPVVKNKMDIIDPSVIMNIRLELCENLKWNVKAIEDRLDVLVKAKSEEAKPGKPADEPNDGSENYDARANQDIP